MARELNYYIYSGRGGGSRSDNSGGGANHLCMPNDPEYMQYASGVQGHSYLYGMEYRLQPYQPLHSVNEHNIPCAVCYTGTRVTVMMIPAKIHCPSGWTVEYTGFLMSEGSSDTRSNYECVDYDPQSVWTKWTQYNVFSLTCGTSVFWFILPSILC